MQLLVVYGVVGGALGGRGRRSHADATTTAFRFLDEIERYGGSGMIRRGGGRGQDHDGQELPQFVKKMKRESVSMFEPDV